MENETPKYKKKSKKQSPKKSKHKHIYKQCLLIDKDERVKRVNYCTECGKVRSFILETEEVVGHSYFKLLNDEEILKKYKNLPKKYVDSIYNTDNISLL